MARTIFYAWQSDRPNKTNRGLILEALTEAAKELQEEVSITEDPRDSLEVDHDTAGVPGSPDIAATIFAKIDSAAVFVCDVTPVADRESKEGSIPNPNVMVELGYALKSLESPRVITVLNTAFGAPDKLPFDISKKRVLTYQSEESDKDRASAKKLLKDKLREALKLSLDHHAKTISSTKLALNPEDDLIAAIRGESPDQRSLSSSFFDSLLSEINSLQPANGDDDEALVRAIDATIPLVTRFATVVKVIARFAPEAVLEEVHRFFEALYEAYDGNDLVYQTDRDLQKFMGHELLVVLVTELVREGKWEAIDDLLKEPFYIKSGRRAGGSLPFCFISTNMRLLDELRKARLASNRTSLRADKLQERYTASPLAKLVTWQEFRESDYLLFVRSIAEQVNATNGEFKGTWFPWSAHFLHGLPVFVTKATTKKYADRLAQGLGMTGTAGMRRVFEEATKRLADFVGFFHSHGTPGLHFDWTKIYE